VFGIRWALLGEIDAAEVFADIDSLRNTLLITGTLLLAVLAIVGIFTARGIAVPLSAITKAMNRLASGDLAVTVPGNKRTDEIGKMAVAFDVFKQQAIDNDRLAQEQDALEGRAAEVKRRTLNELAQSLESSVNHVVQEVSGLADDMESTALGMTRTAEETSRQSGHVSDAAQSAAEFVQNVASAADELSRSITSITSQVQEAGRVAGDAVSNADMITGTMRSLSEAAQRIGQVVDLINGIAGQTNLLALNATIEAARAGDAGKGFAVVAGEVKQLATQTAQATGDIAAQVQMIQSTTRQAVDGMAGIAAIIRRLDQINGEISGAIDQQDRATSDIALSIQSAAASTNTVSGSIGGVTQAAIDTGDAAVHVLTIAGKLNEESTSLLETIEGFVRQLRDTADGDAVELAPPANDSDAGDARPILLSEAAE
jgi:methyl-accepting chemotaxis protein